MTTEAEILAQLPDNETGDIDAVNIRNFVEAVWERFNGETAVPALQFDTSLPIPAHQPGHVHWNANASSLEVDSAFPGVSLQLGQEQWLLVRNTSGSTILNGSPVMITGASANRPTIELDDGQGMVRGVATHNIDNNSFGIVTSFGLVRDFDTSAFNDGDRVYASATGTLTTDITGSHVGVVTLAHPNNGVLFTHPLPVTHADGVTADRPTTRQINFMYFDSTLGHPIWWSGADWVDATGSVV